MSQQRPFETEQTGTHAKKLPIAHGHLSEHRQPYGGIWTGTITPWREHLMGMHGLADLAASNRSFRTFQVIFVDTPKLNLSNRGDSLEGSVVWFSSALLTLTLFFQEPVVTQVHTVT